MQLFLFTAVAANFLSSVKPLLMGLQVRGEKKVQGLWHHASANVIKYFSNQYSSALPGSQTPQGYTRAILSAASPKSRTCIKTGKQRKIILKL